MTEVEEAVKNMRETLLRNPTFVEGYVGRKINELHYYATQVMGIRCDTGGVPKLVQALQWDEFVSVYIVVFFDENTGVFTPQNKVVDPTGYEALDLMEEIAASYWMQKRSTLNVPLVLPDNATVH